MSDRVPPRSAAVPWSTCIIVGGSGFVVSELLPHLLSGQLRVVFSVGEVLAASALISYANPVKL